VRHGYSLPRCEPSRASRASYPGGSFAAMCGRYATTRSTADLTALFDAVDETGGGRLPPDYNVAPTDPVPIVRTGRDGHDGNSLAVARWGLLPHWAKDARAGARMINARAETITTSRAFATAFARHRCLVPADGWYEWLPRPTGGKQAYYMTPRDGGVLAFAGIWSRWQERLTCSIVTTEATGDLVAVHGRMPLLLPPQRWESWLRGPADPEELLATPPAAYLAALEIRPVSPAVGDVRNDGPGLIARVEAPAPGGRFASPTLF
jgi:putative SOS response-associated peptidase YedK